MKLSLFRQTKKMTESVAAPGSTPGAPPNAPQDGTLPDAPPLLSPNDVTVCPSFTATANSGSSGNHEDNPFHSVGLNNPPRGRKNSVDFREAKRRIRKDGLRRRSKQDFDSQRMIYYLYGRGFMYEKPKKERRKEILAIIDEEAPRERLLKVLCHDGDTDLSHDATSQRLYATTIVSLQRYFQQPNAFGFCTEMQHAKYYFRSQKSGNCFMQAPCIMMSYLSQAHGLANPPVDVSTYVRQYFDDKQLCNYVKRDSGGHSIDVLKDLLRGIGERPDDAVTFPATCFTRGKEKLEVWIEKYGPGLVSGFLVHKNFGRLTKTCDIGYYRFNGDHGAAGNFIPLSNEDDESDLLRALEVLDANRSSNVNNLTPSKRTATESTSEPSARLTEAISANEGIKNESEEKHAMVLLGVRKVGPNVWLLLQNWWTHSQIVEVSLDYFRHSEASITFFLQSRSHLSRDAFVFDGALSLNSSLMAECNNLDKKEDPSGPLPVDQPWERKFN